MDEYFITCPRGLEEVTANDIAQHIKDSPNLNKGGVSFFGSLKDLYKVNLYSRTGMYVLKKLFEFKANNYDIIYKKIYQFNWAKIINDQTTFSIRTKVKSNEFENSGYLTLKVKDAIVDKIRKSIGKRPNIDKINSDIKIFLIVKNNQIKIYIDSSGRPLFMRGYRSKIHKASLNECLAAGIILLSNWDKKSLFYDLMCGSGTIPIEAGMIAYNIPPGILRSKFAFQLWNDYDKNLWENVVRESKSKINFNNDIQIFGSDNVRKNIDLSIKSAERINLHKHINFSTKDLSDCTINKSTGVVIVNPPYGVRLGTEENLQNLYKKIGDVFKNKCSGFDTYIFTHNKNLAKFVGLRTRRKFILKNGQLDCRLLYYPIKEGSFF